MNLQLHLRDLHLRGLHAKLFHGGLVPVLIVVAVLSTGALPGGEGKLSPEREMPIGFRGQENKKKPDETPADKKTEPTPERQGRNRQARNQRRRGQPAMTAEEVRKRAPAGVRVETDLSYREGKSKAWNLDLVMPEKESDSPRPGVVFVHGGGWRGGDKRSGFFLRGAYEYAQKGYVCITINYRLTNEAPFPACVEDVKCAVRWFRANARKYNLDPNRIGGYGNSAGAHLVAMLGLVGRDAGLEGDGPHQDQSSLLQAVCASATPTDFPGWSSSGPGRMGSEGGLLAGPADGLLERAKRASPITYVSDSAPPFLLIHGTSDRTVNFNQGKSFVEALRNAGATDVTFLEIEGASHGVFNQHSDETHPAMMNFFERTIGSR